MPIAKCEKCGKEYELNPNENASDFQCECGGELSPKDSSGTVKDIKPKKIRKTWNERSKGDKLKGVIGLLSLGVIILIVIIGVSGMFSNNSKTSDGNPTFQNQYISFEYPTGYNVQPITNSDASNSVMDIGIYKNNNLMGEVSYLENQPSDLTNMEKTSTTTTIASKNAIVSSDSSGLYADVILGTTSTGFNKLIDINIDPSSSDLYNEIKKTLVIKQPLPDEKNS